MTNAFTVTFAPLEGYFSDSAFKFWFLKAGLLCSSLFSGIFFSGAYMKAKITVLLLAIVISGCAIEPLPITEADGKKSYALNCNSGIEKCQQKAAELCLGGYDIIDHVKKSSTVVPHYGEYPMTINIESLTIKCQ